MSPELITLLGAVGTALLAFARWALRLWAQVRREQMAAAERAAERAIEAQKAVAAQASADHQRMIAALIGQAESMAHLGVYPPISTKLDTLVDWRERTPVEGYPRVDIDETELNGERTPSRPGSKRALRTNPQGYRPPKPGDHND
jgi:hypothetical protein